MHKIFVSSLVPAIRYFLNQEQDVGRNEDITPSATVDINGDRSQFYFQVHVAKNGVDILGQICRIKTLHQVINMTHNNMTTYKLLSCIYIKIYRARKHDYLENKITISPHLQISLGWQQF